MAWWQIALMIGGGFVAGIIAVWLSFVLPSRTWP